MLNVLHAQSSEESSGTSSISLPEQQEGGVASSNTNGCNQSPKQQQTGQATINARETACSLLIRMNTSYNIKSPTNGSQALQREDWTFSSNPPDSRSVPAGISYAFRERFKLKGVGGTGISHASAETLSHEGNLLQSNLRKFSLE
jgi:hypothetical protein